MEHFVLIVGTEPTEHRNRCYEPAFLMNQMPISWFAAKHVVLLAPVELEEIIQKTRRITRT